MTRPKPIILCDIDGVLLNFTRVYLEHVLSTTGRVHHESEIHSFTYSDSIVSKEEDAAIWKIITSTPGLVLDLPEYDGAMDFLRKLRKLGRVVACTSPAGPLWTAERAQWLLERGGFCKRDMVICSDKSLVHGDYLIDDHFVNTYEWDAFDEDRTSILFTRPWNRKHPHHCRVHNYAETLELIEGFERC